MPEGLETQVGPLGVRLSGGPARRMAPARMFVREPDLYVLDAERTLWGRMFVEHSEATSLVVSHRQAAQQRADQIIVLDGGCVSARGTLEELMESSDELRRLWTEELTRSS